MNDFTKYIVIGLKGNLVLKSNIFKNHYITGEMKKEIHYIILAIILIFGVFINIIPHYDYENEFYKYPVHVDEWMHYTYSKAVTDQDTVAFDDPFTGENLSFSPKNTMHERGYQTFIGIWQEISGIPWIWLFLIFPTLTFIFLILGVYIFAQRRGYGLEAALLTTLIPTTLCFLGPGFVVPIVFSMIFLPISLWLVCNFKNKGIYFLLAIIFCSLIIIHERGTAAIGIAIIATALFTIKEDWKHSVKTIAIIAIPIIIALIIYYPILQEMGFEPSHYKITDVYHIYGYGAIALFLIGVGIMAFKFNKKDYGLLAATFAYLLVIFLRIKMDVGVFTLHPRWNLFFLLMMGIIGGYGFHWIWKNAKNLFSSEKKISKIWNSIASHILGKKPSSLPAKISRYSIPLASIIVALILLFTIVPSFSAHLDKERYSYILYYYHVIDDRDYEAFVWIRDNVNDSYERGIVEPGIDSGSSKSWRGIAFTPISGKYVYNWFHPGSPPVHWKETKGFFGDKCNDTQFLVKNEISIIYTNINVKNDDLILVRENIYLLNQSLMNW